MGMDQGAALKPARRLCLLDLRQRARPFAIYPLFGPLREPTSVYRVGPLRGPAKMSGSKGLCPLAGIQGAAPLGLSDTRTIEVSVA
jgi:hypothetical protein